MKEMTGGFTIGEITLIYEYHLDSGAPGRHLVDEIVAYELNGKRMSAKEIDEAGFEVPNQWVLQAELDFDYEESFKP